MVREFFLDKLNIYLFIFFSHLYSFHFDASVWWRPSMAALTFPIRLAQCGSGLLISNNAMATVVASVFVGLPLSPTACLIFHPASHPFLTPLVLSPFLALYLAQMGCSLAARRTVWWKAVELLPGSTCCSGYLYLCELMDKICRICINFPSNLGQQGILKLC